MRKIEDIQELLTMTTFVLVKYVYVVNTDPTVTSHNVPQMFQILSSVANSVTVSEFSLLVS